MVKGMAKEFTFKGHTLSELQTLTLEQFAKLATSRVRRTLLRGFNKQLEKRIDKSVETIRHGKEPKPIRTHLRDTVIIPKMVGVRFAVYRGNTFEAVTVTQEMLGHYLGEMVLTRKRLMHGKAGIGATKSSTAITDR